MRLAIVIILGFVLFVSCEVNKTEQFEETIRLDTLRNHSDSNYDILITESFNTQETGSSEGPKAVKFLNKELKEVLKVSLQSRNVFMSFENLKMPPTIISIDFTTANDLGTFRRDSILFKEVLDTYDLAFDVDTLPRKGFWLTSKNNAESIVARSFFSSISSGSKITLKAADSEDVFNSLKFNYPGRFFGIDDHNKSLRYNLEYKLRDLERASKDLESIFVIKDTTLNLETYRFYKK